MVRDKTEIPSLKKVDNMEEQKRRLSVKWLIFFVLGGITVLAFICFVIFKVLLENGISLYFGSFSSDEI